MLHLRQVFLNGDKGVWHDMIYGDAQTSLCKYADMKECVVQPEA